VNPGQGYYVRCATCGDHYWRGADDDDELVCSLCREEQANKEKMRQQQEDDMGIGIKQQEGRENMSPAEIKADLDLCTGTEGYSRFGLTNAVATDGALRMANLCGAFWLLDAIASHVKNAEKLCGEREYQHWKLVVDPASKSAILSVTDGNCRPLNVQTIEYTDFPLPEIRVWVGFQEFGERDVRPVLMLPSEY
jgi:hypothetical protein